MADPDSAPEKNEAGHEQEAVKKDAEKVNFLLRLKYASKHIAKETFKRFFGMQYRAGVNTVLTIVDMIPGGDIVETGTDLLWGKGAKKVGHVSKNFAKTAKIGGKAIGVGGKVFHALDPAPDVPLAAKLGLEVFDYAFGGVVPERAVTTIWQLGADMKKMTDIGAEARNIMKGEMDDYIRHEESLKQAGNAFGVQMPAMGAAA